MGVDLVAERRLTRLPFSGHAQSIAAVPRIGTCAATNRTAETIGTCGRIYRRSG